MTIVHKSGNTLSLSLQVTKDGAALDLTGAGVRYRLERGEAGPLVFSEGVGLTINNPPQGQLTLAASSADMTIDQGSHLGAMEITLPSGAIIELPDTEMGDVWEIIPQLIT